jgi:hypothetical protein
MFFGYINMERAVILETRVWKEKIERKIKVANWLEVMLKPNLRKHSLFLT